MTSLARALVRRSHPKVQPRPRRPKNPGESATRDLLKERSEKVCEVCGHARAESVHHRRKQSQGGPWSGSNCLHVCGDGTRGCHGWIEHNPDAAALSGWHLRPGEEPEVRAVLYRNRWVLLGDDGSISAAEEM